MNTDRKVRTDAVLKTLPLEKQEAIADYAFDHKLSETREWLASEGIATSATAISRFLTWFGLVQANQQHDGAMEALPTCEKEEDPEEKPEKVQKRGQKFFSKFAVAHKDFKAWVQVQQIALKRERMDLDWKVFRRAQCEAFVKLCNDATARAIADDKISYAEKIEKIGKLMFGKLWSGNQ